jgi:hypothetical protein
VGAGGAWQAINFTRDESSVERRALEQLADKQVLGLNSARLAAVSGGGLVAACMKASGEGAGTKAGLGVEESRADETQEAPRNAKKSFDLTCFNSIPLRPSGCNCVQAGERKVRVILVRASERALLAYKDAGEREADLLLFFSPGTPLTL